jgi:polar amino acid transport system substrate-binding protein/glutamate/aspartate transport system substrate-binding protein
VHPKELLINRRAQIMRVSAALRLRKIFIAALLTAVPIVSAGGASAGTLDRIRQDKTIRIAYREDAPPFSYKNSIGEPAGFMVDLCRAVAKKLTDQLQLSGLSVLYVPVTAANRFDAIEQNKADLLCEPTSATLSRRAMVDFSIATYLDGASLMIRADGPRDLQALTGKKVGVLGGTTTEQALRKTLKDGGINADIVLTKTHAEGVALLDAGTIEAYFADRDILTSLIAESKDPTKLAVANNYLTVEPYALALPHGDEDFRLAVDTALSHIYRSGEIGPIFQQNFSTRATQSPLLQALYLLSGLPD